MPYNCNKTKKYDKKALAFLALMIALAVMAVGTTLAYVIVKTASINNVFTPPIVDVSLNGNEVKNTGDIDVYARVAIVANWVNEEDGSILSTNPKVTITLEDGWAKISDDGFYYLTTKLAPGTASTPVSSAALADGETTPSGYKLQVTVLASVIQATPAEAVEAAWGVTVNTDGTLNVPTN